MSDFVRKDGRATNQLREVTITRNWLENGEGNVLVSFGRTRVLCVASFTEGVPRWKKDSGEGWVTAEYAMLPRAGSERSGRESVRGKVGGRTHEISRLIGRSLRGIIEEVMLDVMFDIPRETAPRRVTVTKECITEGAAPTVENAAAG